MTTRSPFFSPAPAAEAAAFEYRDGFGPLPATPTRRVTARAQSDECYSLNWDDVELIAQPNEFTCWATAAAMVIGWRDQICLTPETVAGIRIKGDNIETEVRKQAAELLENRPWEAPLTGKPELQAVRMVDQYLHNAYRLGHARVPQSQGSAT